MAELVVTATLDGGGAPFRIAATDRGIAAAGWDPDEDAFQTDLGEALPRTGGLDRRRSP